MNELLTRNLAWKIVSLLLAIILWLIVINIQNPTKPATIPDIPVTILHGDEVTNMNKAIKYIEGETVTVRVQGKRFDVENLEKNKWQIQAVADIELINEYGAVEIQVIPPSENITVLKKSPTHMKVELEDIITVQKAIIYEPVGQPAEGYVSREADINPNIISIRGPESQIAKISAVRVKVDIEGKNKDASILEEPKIYDSEGKEITKLNKSVEKVKVVVPIQKYKTIPVQVGAWEPGPPEDYVLTDYKVEPKEITIVGNEEAVNQMKNIQLPDISLGDVIETQVFSQDITTLLPDGVELWNGDENITITAEIKKEQSKEFAIPVNELNVRNWPDGLQFKFITKEDIPVTLKGLEEDMEEVSIDQLEGNVNLTGYDKGQHEIPVDFIIPRGFEMVGEAPTVTIELIEGEPLEEEEVNQQLESTTTEIRRVPINKNVEEDQEP